ncbi:hypothetical protein [Leucobacter sp. wl10]|uniref:hypothetical protein n=1 Tax=Leucobacter sp. wl10 TaxID=2304677 RepID=UPI0013C327F9|nr:hypothetical protein [Leucobacter sp. wl10]
MPSTIPAALRLPALSRAAHCSDLGTDITITPPINGMNSMSPRRNPLKNPVVFIPSTLVLSVAVAIANYQVIGGIFA